MTNVDHDMLIATLDRLKLTAIRDQLDTLLDEAARSKMTLREALVFLVSREIAHRDERRISMSSKMAQFPFVRELDGFDFEAQPSLDQGQIRELATCRWIAHGGRRRGATSHRHPKQPSCLVRTDQIQHQWWPEGRACITFQPDHPMGADQMSLFIGLLAFSDPNVQDHIKTGIPLGSATSGLIGEALLMAFGRRAEE